MCCFTIEMRIESCWNKNPLNSGPADCIVLRNGPITLGKKGKHLVPMLLNINTAACSDSIIKQRRVSDIS